MKKYLTSLSKRVGSSFASRARSLAVRLFSRKEIRSTLAAAVLAFMAPFASASGTDLSDLSTATDIVCLISTYISGPWLFVIGVVLMIVGAVAIANSESTIGKLISTVFVGLGFASAAVPIVKNHLKLNYVC